MRWLLLKDLQLMRRSPLVVALLVLYPILLAVLIGFALSRGPEKPKVAFFNQVSPQNQDLVLGGRKIGVNKYATQLFRNIEPIKVGSREAAIEKVHSGEALGAVIVPPDLAQKLSTQVERPVVEVFVNEEDPVKARYVDQVISSQLARANEALSRLLTREAVGSVDLLIDGGAIDFFGKTLKILGLKRAERATAAALRELPRNSKARRGLRQVEEFARLGQRTLDVSQPLLATLSEPIQVKKTAVTGSAPPLSSFAAAAAASFSLMFVTLLLAAGMLAVEREENAFQRLVRGPLSPLKVIVEKTVMAQLCATVVALLLLSVMGLFVSLAWDRFPLWLVAAAAGAGAFAAMGVAIGGLAREVRAASLLTVMIAFPIVFMGLIPSGAIAQSLYTLVTAISAIFPFKPTLDALNAALYSSGQSLLWPTLHLVVLIGVYGVLARLVVRRLG